MPASPPRCGPLREFNKDNQTVRNNALFLHSEMAAEVFRLREKKTWITQRKDQASGWTETTSTVELQAMFAKMLIIQRVQPMDCQGKGYILDGPWEMNL